VHWSELEYYEILNSEHNLGWIRPSLLIFQPAPIDKSIQTSLMCDKALIIDIQLHVLMSVLLTLAVFCIVPAFFSAAFLATGFLVNTLAAACRFRSERALPGLLTVPNAFAGNYIKNNKKNNAINTAKQNSYFCII